MKFVAFPKQPAPYCVCLYQALEADGATVLDGQWNFAWLRQHVARGDVVHLNWPSFLYSGGRRGIGVARRFAKFLLLMAWLRLRGARLWWTAHNLLPHERHRWPVLDVVARRVTIACAEHVFVHGEHARQVLVEAFPSAARKSRLISHGNWIAHYARAPERAAARRQLGLPEQAFVYLFLGQCRPYKNLGALVRAFSRLPGEHLRLVVAGTFSDAAYRQEIEALAAADPRVLLQPRYVDDAELPVFMGACDVMCLPYREILTSGSAMLALSFGRPVISIDRGFLRDVITDGAGLLIPAGDEAALQSALQDAQRAAWNEAHIVAQAQSHTFEGAARVLLRTAVQRAEVAL
jgi:glycosyltransferase involved in cell wall biosynthesis